MDIDTLNAALSDRYRIERELGRGGMAVVYLAHDWNLGRDVALKVLLPELAASLGGQRFLREIEIAAKLNHPNILSLHDRGEVDGLLYYTMPYVDGDVVHRDIKPENILLQGDHAMVADFGIARAVTEAGGEKLTQTGIAVGTVTYMAPEQSAAGKDVDARSDLYSLGCVLYEMIGGEPPFTGPSAQAIMARHALDPPPAVSTIRPATPPGVEEVILRALAKNAVDRYKTAEHMRVVLSDPEIAVVSAAGRLRRFRRSRVTRVGMGVAATAAVTFGAWRLLTAGTITPPPTAGLVAVLPFQVDSQFERPLDQASIVNLVRSNLASLDRYRVIPDEDVRRAVERLCPKPPIERFCGTQVATELGAQYHVTGEVTPVRRDSVSIVAYLTDVVGGRTIPPVTLRGSQAEAFELLRRLFQELAGATAGDDETVAAGAAFSTENLVAFAALMDAELYLGRGKIDSATASLERATEADSTYALAWYRMALVEDWNGNSVAARRAAVMAEANAEKLSDHDRRILQGYIALVEGDAQAAEGIYQELLVEDPDDFEALMQLGYLYWAQGSRVGAVEPLRRAIRLGHSVSAPVLLWALVAGSADDPSMLDEADSLSRAHGFGFELPLAGIRAIRNGDSIALTVVLDSIEGGQWCDPPDCYLPFDGMIMMPQYIREGIIDSDVPALAMFIPLVESLSDSTFLHDYIESYLRVADPSPDWRKASGDLPADVARGRTLGYMQVADLEGGRGRWGAVKAALRKMDMMGNSEAPVRLAMLATQPRPGDVLPVDVDSLRAELETWDWESVPSEVMRQVGPALRLASYGILSAHQGDYQAARAFADQLEAMDPAEILPTKHLDLAAGVRADVFLREGQPAEALAVLEQAPRLANHSAEFGVPGIRERILQGRALFFLGRYEEALPWFTTSGSRPGELTSLAPLHYYRAETYEAMGNNERALWHYDAFVDLWLDADAEFQPQVEEARRRMARLAGEE